MNIIKSRRSKQAACQADNESHKNLPIKATWLPAYLKPINTHPTLGETGSSMAVGQTLSLLTRNKKRKGRLRETIGAGVHLLGERSEPHTAVQLRFRYVGMYVCRVLKCVGGITYTHAQSLFWAVKTDL